VAVAQEGAYTRSAPGGAGARSALTQRILDGAPLPLLLAMASPNAVAFFVQAAVSMAEIGFVAQLGTEPLAALALMFPGLMLMQMLANGALGGAVSSAVARALGAGDRDRAEALIWHALIIAGAAGGLFLVIYLVAGEGLLQAFGAAPAVTAAADAYARIVFGGAAVLWLTALLSAVFRGMGNMRFPALLMVAGAALQVPLAGTLILGWFGMPRLGLEGAALAVIAVAALNGSILLVRRLAGSRNPPVTQPPARPASASQGAGRRPRRSTGPSRRVRRAGSRAPGRCLARPRRGPSRWPRAGWRNARRSGGGPARSGRGRSR